MHPYVAWCNTSRFEFCTARCKQCTLFFFSAPVGLMAQVGNAILPEEYKPKKLEDDRKAQEWYVINRK